MQPDARVIDWLLQADPWVAYRTRTDLLGESLSNEQRQQYVAATLADPRVGRLVEDVKNWFPSLITRHNDAKIVHYKLRMLADFGLTREDGLEGVIDTVRQHQRDGLLAIRQALPFGAESGEEWHALPCDNPILTHTLLSMCGRDELLDRQIEHLKEQWSTPDGWFCHFPFVESQYKKEHKGCPMAGLMALEAFSLREDLKESQYAKNAFQAVADHYELGRSIYYFGRGRKFFTFKYPYVWYNALYMADVLSRFGFAKGHAMSRQLVEWIEDAGESGRYKPISVFMEYKDWEFSNKKEYSPWITLLCHRILKRFSS